MAEPVKEFGGENGMAKLQRKRKALLKKHAIKVKHGESIESAVVRVAAAAGWDDTKRSGVLSALKSLAAQIKEERRAVATFLSTDHSLETYNDWLINLKCDPQPSLSKARKVLRTVHINIYDLKDRKFRNRKRSVAQLSAYTRALNLYYPLRVAKKALEKVFLRVIGKPGASA